MSRRLRIGLTGGIASGKSTVASRFIELGVPVIDADEVARAVVEPGQPGLAQVVDRFGAEFVTPAGELDRRALRDRVFADPQARKDLEAILHPLIRAEMERRADAGRADLSTGSRAISAASSAPAAAPYLVMAIPLLVEGNNRNRVDRILVVDADESVQMQRLLARDGITAEQAGAILAAQATRAARLKAADDVLVNSSTVSLLHEAVDCLHARYLQLAAALAARETDLT